jgi:hypothetical protein
MVQRLHYVLGSRLSDEQADSGTFLPLIYSSFFSFMILPVFKFEFGYEFRFRCRVRLRFRFRFAFAFGFLLVYTITYLRKT